MVQWSYNYFLVFNTNAFYYRQGKDMYIYFVLDNLPMLIGMPYLIIQGYKWYKEAKERKEASKLNHIKLN